MIPVPSVPIAAVSRRALCTSQKALVIGVKKHYLYGSRPSSRVYRVYAAVAGCGGKKSA